MKKLSLAVVLFFALGMIASCGGSSGSGGGGSTCGHSDTTSPFDDLSGTWNLYMTMSEIDCPITPSWISCTLTFVQAAGSNEISVSGTCTSDLTSGITVNNMPAWLAGSTLYWEGVVAFSDGTYSESDTIPCSNVNMTSSSQSATFSGITISVSYNNDGTVGTCSSYVSSGDFTKTSS